MQKQVTEKCEAFLGKQPPVVDALCQGVLSGAQGGLMGGVLGKLTAGAMEGAMKSQPAGAPAMPTLPGTPIQLAANLAALSGASTATSHYIKKYTKQDDGFANMCGGFSGGAAYSLMSNTFSRASGPPMPNMPAPPTTAAGIVMDMLRSGCIFGLFYLGSDKLGKWFQGGGAEVDVQYYHTKVMLEQLGLSEYEKNFRKGKLTDACLPLLDQYSLAEVKIPPGPRLLITNYCAQQMAGARAAAAPALAVPAAGPNEAIPQLSLAVPVEGFDRY